MFFLIERFQVSIVGALLLGVAVLGEDDKKREKEARKVGTEVV